MPEAADLPEAKDCRLNRAVAATVVALSVMMALSKIKDDNIVQAMQADQAAQIDIWNEYQATRLKLHLEAMAQAAAGPGAAQAAGEVERYTRESDALRGRALAAKADYDRAGYRDDQFDLADGFASIALATTAISVLVEAWWLLGFSWGAAALAVLFNVAGFAALPLHPDALIAFLT